MTMTGCGLCDVTVLPAAVHELVLNYHINSYVHGAQTNNEWANAQNDQKSKTHDTTQQHPSLGF